MLFQSEWLFCFDGSNVDINSTVDKRISSNGDFLPTMRSKLAAKRSYSPAGHRFQR